MAISSNDAQPEWVWEEVSSPDITTTTHFLWHFNSGYHRITARVQKDGPFWKVTRNGEYRRGFDSAEKAMAWALTVAMLEE